MDYLPIFVKLDARPCLVVGGGEVAWRKIGTLMKVGAAVTVVAPEADERVREAALRAEIVWLKTTFIPEHLSGMFLVIAATDNSSINALVSSSANVRHVFVNVVDDTEKCNFIFPSIVDRSPIVIAISSAGKAPVLARMLREKLETLMPFHLGRMATIAGQFRETLKQKIGTFAGRRKFWEMAFEGRFNTLVAAGDDEGAKIELARLSSNVCVEGEVAFIGTGPGNPGLLTLRALQLMQQADVVLYHHLVSEEITALCRRDAKLICVGAVAEKHRSQAEGLHEKAAHEETNALLLKYAQKGKRVVHLKGGDPFMFDCAAGELQRLKQAGVPFQIVPGISS